MVFILIGAFLRVYNIGFQNFWTEEEYSLNISSLPIIDLIFKSFASDFNPPVYYLFAHLSLLLTNGLDFSIRYPSVISGILLIPAMYWVGVTYKDEIAGLYCAGLITIILPFIYYAQFGRAYAMSLLFFALAFVYYIKLKSENTRRNRIIFWVLALLNMWTHLFATIPIGLMCIDLLFDRKNWLCGIGAFVCSLPLVGMLVNVLSTRNGGSFDYGASWIQMVVLTPMEFFNTVFLNVLMLAGVGLWFDKNPIKKNLIIITVITLIVGVVGSAFTPFFPRYYMTVALIILLMAVVGIIELTETFNKRIGVDLTYFVMIGIFIVFTWMLMPNLESHYFIQQYVS